MWNQKCVCTHSSISLLFNVTCYELVSARARSTWRVSAFSAALFLACPLILAIAAHAVIASARMRRRRQRHRRCQRQKRRVHAYIHDADQLHVRFGTYARNKFGLATAVANSYHKKSARVNKFISFDGYTWAQCSHSIGENIETMDVCARARHSHIQRNTHREKIEQIDGAR